MNKLSIKVLGALTILISVAALAQSGGEFTIVNSSIDNGGGRSSGGEFSLTGTIGQHDASVQAATGGEFILAGGFWANANDIGVIFRDSFETN